MGKKQGHHRFRPDHTADTWAATSPGVPIAGLRTVMNNAKQYQSDPATSLPFPFDNSTAAGLRARRAPTIILPLSAIHVTANAPPNQHWYAIAIDERLVHRSKFHPRVIWACIRAWWRWPN